MAYRSILCFLTQICPWQFGNLLNDTGVLKRMSESSEFVTVMQSFLKYYSMAMVLHEILKKLTV